MKNKWHGSSNTVDLSGMFYEEGNKPENYSDYNDYENDSDLGGMFFEEADEVEDQIQPSSTVVLNEQQQLVSSFEYGSCLSLASPGSGKTRCVKERVKNLISLGHRPENIFACTFTKKSSNEIKERLIKDLGNEIGSKVKTSTIHSLCYQVYLKYIYMGFGKPPLVNEYALNRILYAEIKDKKTLHKDPNSILQSIALRKLNINPVPDNLYQLYKSGQLKVTNVRDHSEAYFYFFHRDYLTQRGELDFNDMLYKTYLFLKDNPDTLEHISKKIKFLIVDEAQDANKLSYELYKMFCSYHKNIQMIGDKKQSIYSFQGSHYFYLDKFQNEFNAKVIELPLNYRSHKEIVDASQTLINTSRVFESTKIEAFRGYNKNSNVIEALESPDEINEAFEIVERVKQLIDHGNKPDDIAILYRVNAQSIPLVDILSLEGIPFVIDKKTSFYNKKHIKCIIAYIKAISGNNSLSSEEIKLILQNPTNFLKTQSTDKITKSILKDMNKGMVFINALSRAIDLLADYEKKNVTRLLQNIGKIAFVEGQSNTVQSTTKDIISYILYSMGLYKHYQDQGSEYALDQDITLSLDVLSQSVSRFEKPSQFITYVNGVQNKKESKKGVRLHTIHSTKGLEFKNVIIAGFCSKIYPYFRASTAEEREEELRIAFVGITRAMDKLILSTIRGKFGRFNVEPSIYFHILKGKHEIVFNRC